MGMPREVNERDLACALYCIARMVDEEGTPKNCLLIKILNNKTYFRAQQGHRAAQAPNPEISHKRIIDPDAQGVTCMVRDSCYMNLASIVNVGQSCRPGDDPRNGQRSWNRILDDAILGTDASRWDLNAA